MRKKLQPKPDNQKDYQYVLRLEIGFYDKEFVNWDLNYNYENLTTEQLQKVSDYLSRRLMEVHAEINKHDIEA